LVIITVTTFTIISILMLNSLKTNIKIVESDAELKDYEINFKFNTEIMKPILGIESEEIEYIYFGKEIPEGATNLSKKMDISKDKKNTVHLYYSIKTTKSDKRYNLYIVGRHILFPENSSNMFFSNNNLTKIDGLEFVNTSHVTDMAGMFVNCKSLLDLNVSNFNTSNVTNMSNMFEDCSLLTELDVSNFNTSNVANMGGMFIVCKSLSVLDISNFDTSNVTNMSGMFSECSSLSVLDLSNFDTSNVTQMTRMFYDCTSLSVLDLSNFDTSKVTFLYNIFFNTHINFLNIGNCSLETSKLLLDNFYPSATITVNEDTIVQLQELYPSITFNTSFNPITKTY
ncbi:MAG: BspA family leucine-rich repeat surface protein, partial [Anaeroplasmataceae bacterium]